MRIKPTSTNLQDTSSLRCSIEVIIAVLVIFLFVTAIAAIAFFASGCGEESKTPPVVLDELSAPAGRHVGMGYYGMMHPDWPCAKSLQIMKHQKRPSVSVVWNIFGRDLRCIKQFIADPRHKVVEIQLVNACCQRNGSCQSYDLLQGISVSQEHNLISSNNNKFRKALLTHIKPIIQLILDSANTNTRFIISPELESNLPCSDGETLINWLKPAFLPTTQFAWSAIRGCRPPSADFRAYHGYIPYALQVPCTANLDGNDIALPVAGRHTSTLFPHIEYNQLDNYINNTANCALSHLWTYEMNGGLYNYSNPDRRARTNWPSDAVFDVLQPCLK